MAMFALPEVMVRSSVEYPRSSARGAVPRTTLFGQKAT
jgi:hypothetical protein